MPTALFQCLNNAAVERITSRLENCPHDVTRVWPFDKWLCAAFNGDCYRMYCWSMDLVTVYPGSLAFIGIDENAVYADDPYKLVILTDMPVFEANKNAIQIKYYDTLISAFLRASTILDFDHDEILTVCQRCVLGDYTKQGIEYCANLVDNVFNNPGTVQLRNLLMYSMAFAQLGLQSTMVRVMAHFCYQAHRQRRRPTRLERLRDRIFGGDF